MAECGAVPRKKRMALCGVHISFWWYPLVI
jgi:hypothetical protein